MATVSMEVRFVLDFDESDESTLKKQLYHHVIQLARTLNDSVDIAAMMNGCSHDVAEDTSGPSSPGQVT